MALQDALERAARELAAQAQQRVSDLEREALELKKRQAQNEAECDAARGAANRALKPPIKVGVVPACPSCWVTSGRQSPMHTVPSVGRSDIYECSVCGFDLEV